MVATTKETTRTTPSAVLFPDSLASKSNIAPRVNIPPATIAVKLTNCPTRDILKQFLSHNFDNFGWKPGHHDAGEGEADGESDPGDCGQRGGGQADVDLGLGIISIRRQIGWN